MRPIRAHRLLLACLLLLLPALPLGAQRAWIPLSTWSFLRRDVTPREAVDAAWRRVTVPHCWNIQDGPASRTQEGPYRGPGWYATPLPLGGEQRGSRVFVRFEAACTVADVYLNGTFLGQHRGAFAAFCCELTQGLRWDGRDELRVRVDNGRFEDVPPLQGDFSLQGGLYRPVSLLVTGPDCISPLDHGSCGVYLKAEAIQAERAEVACRVLVSATGAGPLELEAVVTAPDGAEAARGRGPVLGGEGRLTLAIAHPQLWEGVAAPRLYQAEIRLLQGGRVVDRLTQPLGLRTLVLDPGRGVLLNGMPYDLHGVNRHQDREGKGWALSDADHAEDLAAMVDLGCTGARLAHYQQSATVHDLCDRNGLLLWQELPLVERISGLAGFRDNARQQLTEMILQGFNHPSLCFWGLFNELDATWSEAPCPDPADLIAELRALADTLDGTRPTVGASFKRKAWRVHALPAGIAFNLYPGWYWGQPEDFGPEVEKLSRLAGGGRIGLSEYGAGGSVAQHQEGPLARPGDTSTHFHPEEWQTRLHERLWAQIQGNPHLWCSFLWVMFDFAVDARDEGDSPRRNDKGLVTADRHAKKDAFYFYQANWSRKPMAHLAESRLNPRRQARVDVKAYSNLPSLDLRVGGAAVARAVPDACHTFRWPEVALAPGANVVEVAGPDGMVLDRLTWVREP